MSATASARPRVAVWKFASCDGCQLTLLDCEDELLEVAGALDLSYFLEAGVDDGGTGTYDLSIVEGSITTAHDAERIRSVRARSTTLVTIGACATAGGIQALRNFADVEAFLGIVYAHPSFISTLDTSTAIADHVPVDLELRGCPISKHQLLELIAAVLIRRRPITPGHAVCMTCKAQGNVCVTVAHGTPCFGPITHDGCGSLCPSYARGCYGCFGPSESAQVRTLADHLEGTGMDPDELALALRTFNAWAEPFRAESERRGVPVSIGRRP
jgi:coenzyme F420-reducing hydrogenase gamma subunit